MKHRLARIAGLALFALTACSGSPIVPSVSNGSGTGQGWTGPASPSARTVAANGHLYIAREGGITVINANDGHIARAISTGDNRTPATVAVDRQGNIYATEPNAVAVFDRTSDRPIRRITNGISHPFGLAFDTAGNLYVTNTFFKPGVVTGGSVSVYAPGAMSPKRTLTDSMTGIAGPIAVSSTGYVYAVNTPQNENRADVVVFGSSGTRALRTIPGFAYMIALDAHDRLYVSHSLAGASENGAVDAYSVDGAATHLLDITQGVRHPMLLAIDQENVWVAMGDSLSVNNYDLSGRLIGGTHLGSFMSIAAGPNDALFVARHATTAGGSVIAFAGSRQAYVVKNVHPFWIVYSDR